VATIVLSGIGAVAGAFVGVGAFECFGIIVSSNTSQEPVPAIMAVGGVLGALLGPGLAWGLLRRVPLGAALWDTVVAGFLGTMIGLASIAVPPLNLLWPVIFGPLGATAAAVMLRKRHATRPLPDGVLE
jgi:hypothetical protein